MGLLGGIVKLLVIILLAVVGLAAYLYFTDFEAEGTITDKGTDSGGDYVVIKPKLLLKPITQHIDSNAAQFLCEGYHVGYRVQSKHYTVSDAGGRVVYDSETGLNDALTPTRCAVLGA